MQMISFRMFISYPLCYAFERTVIRSQTFEKTWSNMRPHLERGIELIAQEAHPEGRSLVRKYVYQEPAVRRVVNDCLREIFSTRYHVHGRSDPEQSSKNSRS